MSYELFLNSRLDSYLDLLVIFVGTGIRVVKDIAFMENDTLVKIQEKFLDFSGLLER